MQDFDKYVVQELGAKVGNLVVENSALKVQLQQAHETASRLAERLKKYENEDGAPHGDSIEQRPKVDTTESSKASK